MKLSYKVENLPYKVENLPIDSEVTLAQIFTEIKFFTFFFISF